MSTSVRRKSLRTKAGQFKVTFDKLPLETPKDIRIAGARLFRALMAGNVEPGKARAGGYLLGVVLRSLVFSGELPSGSLPGVITSQLFEAEFLRVFGGITSERKTEPEFAIAAKGS